MKFVELLESDNKIVMFDDQWGAFMDACNHLPEGTTLENACAALNLPYILVKKAVEQIIPSWRDSVSTSLLNGLTNVHLQKPPSGPIFMNIKQQTRFLTMAKKERVIRPLDVTVLTNDEKLTADVYPMTAKQSSVNALIRYIYLYFFLNSRKKVKLPKVLYRGIRAHDLYHHETFAPILAEIWKSDKSREMKRKEAVDALIKFICDKKLHTIVDGKLLSFTASIPIAKYFAHGEGFILKVDSSKVEIVTSELHDEELSGPEPYANKVEKEYIIRIPEDYDFKPEDIMIHDLDYFIAERNPLCVALFDHDDKSARYNLNGYEIRAEFRWSSNSSGGLRFSASKDGKNIYGQSRNSLKTEIGFDPLPTKDNLDKITNFKLFKQQHGTHSWKEINETISTDLSPWEFDQSKKGWRSIKNKNEQINALFSYIKKYTASSVGWKNNCPKFKYNLPPAILMFHLGQLYAMKNDRNSAIKWFKKSIIPGDKNWNAYVNATIAFLQNNINAFDRYAKEDNQNQETLKRLRNNWGKSYSEAY